MPNVPIEVLEAKPAGKRFANEIGAFASRKWKNGAVMATTIAGITFQNVLMSMMTLIYKPGSEEGREFIGKFYDAAKNDAQNHWNEKDLKQHFGGKQNG